MAFTVEANMPQGSTDTSVWALSLKAGDQRPVRLGLGDNPAYSPSGQLLTYVRSTGQGLEAVALSEGTHQVRRTWSNCRGLARSPNGEHWVLARSGDDECRLVLTDGAGDLASGHQLAGFPSLYAPLFSPDGRWLAYARHLSRPIQPSGLVNVQTRKEYAVPFPGGPPQDWSADGRYLLAVRARPDPRNDGSVVGTDLCTVKMPGRRVKQVARDSNFGRFLPNTTQVLFTRKASGWLYLSERNGSVRRLVQVGAQAFAVTRTAR